MFGGLRQTKAFGNIHITCFYFLTGYLVHEEIVQSNYINESNIINLNYSSTLQGYHVVLDAHNSNFKIMCYINKYIFHLYDQFKLLIHF